MKKCTQLCEPNGTRCTDDAEFSYLWPPDGEEYFACMRHTAKVLRIGEAVGVKIRLRRVALEEAKKNVLRAAVYLWSKMPDHGADELEQLSEAVEQMIREETRTLQLQMGMQPTGEPAHRFPWPIRTG
jgi:hypothetical protein